MGLKFITLIIKHPTPKIRYSRNANFTIKNTKEKEVKNLLLRFMSITFSAQFLHIKSTNLISKGEKQMNITDVRIYPVEKGNFLASASITIDDELVVKGFKIMAGKNGEFVSNPATKGSNGEYFDNVFCLTKEAREELNTAILDAWDNASEEDVAPAKPKTASKSRRK